jgi:hypothetical protein
VEATAARGELERLHRESEGKRKSRDEADTAAHATRTKMAAEVVEADKLRSELKETDRQIETTRSELLRLKGLGSDISSVCKTLTTLSAQK